MKWMRNRELPPWAYLLGCLLLAAGCWMIILTKNFLLGIPLMCIGSWLMRWWFEVPADHPRFQKMSKQRFHLYRNMMSAGSWGILVLMVAAVCFSVFGVVL